MKGEKLMCHKKMNFLDWFKGDPGTIRPLKTISPEHRGYKLAQLSQATLGAGTNLIEAVKLPKGESLNDWLANGVVEFYNTLASLYSLIKDECTAKNCPEMKAGPHFTYAWQDSKMKKSQVVPAPDYINNVFEWVGKQVDDESIFPSNQDVPFPSDFKQVVSKIFQRYFRIYAHIFHHHRKHMSVVGGEPHLNTTFKHFMYFVHEFDLIPENQLQPLKDIIPKFD